MSKAENARKARNQRRKKKNALIRHKGGKCTVCGYNGLALAFHHRNPKQKGFQISNRLTWKLDTLLAEVEKCDLVCMNCHHEIEHGCVM